jgi:hypothetical protein
VREVTKQFLNLFFNKDETICVSDCQGGYYSIPQQEMEGDIQLVSPKEDKPNRYTREEFIKLVAINPINGWRRDENVTCYRTFMIECDDMPIPQQWDYIKKMEFPTSYACFSGSKSIHFALVLDHEIPSEYIYKYTYQWILNIMTEADQKTKNPTRSIRFPGVIRSETGKEQKLLHMGERVSLDTLNKWLNKYPHKAPKPLVRKTKNTGKPNVKGIKPWAKKALVEGVHNMEGSRNQTWMSIGCEMALNGFSLDNTIYYLEDYFEEQSDFKKQEWLTAIKSGWHYADKISV